jgi:hypothetical protein
MLVNQEVPQKAEQQSTIHQDNWHNVPTCISAAAVQDTGHNAPCVAELGQQRRRRCARARIFLAVLSDGLTVRIRQLHSRYVAATASNWLKQRVLSSCAKVGCMGPRDRQGGFPARV